MKRGFLKWVIGVALIIGATQGIGCTWLLIPSLRAAPEQVTVDGIHYTLMTYLWRDFQPVSPVDGKPLSAVVSIITDDVTGIPAGIDATTMWVLNGCEVWETALSNMTGPGPSTAMGRVAGDGPKWGPGIYVDVVVKMEDGTGRAYLLQAKHQYISRTD